MAGRIGIPTQPLRLSGIDRWTSRAAPTLGQHNSEVLSALGLDPDALQAVRSEHTKVLPTR